MKKYDIGILTFWNVPNYGTFAQAYALQKAIKNICPEKDVRQINHLDDRHFNFYYDEKAYLRSFPIWKKAFWKSFNAKDKREEGKKTIFFNAYNGIPHTEKIDNHNSNEFLFDKVFLGSDIVWDFSIEPFNHDKFLFGAGLNAKEINSYAASFGTVKKTTDIPQYVIENVKTMKHILVRDENSAEIVNKICGRKPEVVLDPVWLWDFKNDTEIPKPNEKDYILVYGQDFTNNFIKNLIRYAEKHNKRIIALDCNEDNYTWCDKLIKQKDLDPLTWIGYFKFADEVATSTFHGVTFSLLFNKKMAFCKTDFILAKLDKFLEELQLLDLFNDCDDVEKMLDYNWDYNFVNKIVAKKREKSLKLLKEACI